MTAGQPMTQDRQITTIGAAAAHRQNNRTPVFGMVQRLFQLQQVLACPFEHQPDTQITPARNDLFAIDEIINPGHDRGGSKRPIRINQQHYAGTSHRTQQRSSPVAVTKRRAVTGVLGNRFIERRQVNRSISDHKRHRDQRSDRVQITRDDTDRGQHIRQNDRPARFGIGSAAGCEQLKLGKDRIACQSLEDARCSHHAAKGAGQRRSKDASGDQPRPKRDTSNNQTIIMQRFVGG